MQNEPIYEKLERAVTIREFITESVFTFEQEIDQLINRVFRQDDFVVKSVIDSLFETSGPLSDLTIRLKVLFGLGVINDKIFADIMHFVHFNEALANEAAEPAFSDPSVIQFALGLALFADKNLLDLPIEQEDTDSLLFQMKQMRKEKLVRSGLVLLIIEIIEIIEHLKNARF